MCIIIDIDIILFVPSTFGTENIALVFRAESRWHNFWLVVYGTQVLYGKVFA